MGRIVKFGLEDDLAPLDDAISAQNKMDSTDPQDVVQVANYKDELEKLRQQNGQGGEDGGDGSGTDDTGATSGSDDTDPAGTDDDTSKGEGGNDSDKEDGGSSDASDSSEAVEPTDENVSAANEAISTMNAIGKIHGIMERRLQYGGVSGQAAKMGDQMASILAKRLGLEYRQESPAVEEFDSVSTRIRATRVAMEGLRNFLVELWQAIVNFFKKLWKWISDFLFTRRKGVEASQSRLDGARRIQEQLANKKLNEERVERFSKEKFRQRAAILLTKAKEGDSTDVLASAKMISDISTSALKALTTEIPNRFRSTLALMSNGDTDKWRPFIVEEDDLSPLHLDRNNVMTNTLSNSGNNGTVVLQSDGLPGNRRLVATVLKNGQVPLPEYYHGKHSVTIVRDASLGDLGREVLITMDPKVVKTLTTKAKDLFDLHEKISNFMKTKLEEMVAAFGKKAEGELAKIKTGNPSANTKVLSAIVSHSMSNIQATVTKMAANVVDYLADFADALVDYVSFCTRKITDCVEGK